MPESPTTTVQAVFNKSAERRQFLITIPASLARAIDLEGGEAVEWKLLDRYTLQIHRPEVKRIEDQMRRKEAREAKRRDAVQGDWRESPRE